MWEAIVEMKVQGFLNQPTPESQANVVNQIVVEYAGELSADLRCVRGRALKVRDEPKSDAPTISTLIQMQGIEVLESRGPWSRIRYFDQKTGKLTEGWAASAYLSRYKCEPAKNS